MKRGLFLTASLAVLLPCLFEARAQAPVERAAYAKLTSHADLMRFTFDLVRDNPAILRMETVATSHEGRDIVALLFSKQSFGSNRDTKPVVLIFCQQHGDEPSGKEAALIIARELTGRLQGLLDHLDLILIPQLNPDGSDALKRENAKGADLNRDHVLLSEPEVAGLHRLFRRWMPEVTLDVHEYNAVSSWWMDRGMVKNAEEMLDTVSNLNIAESLRAYAAAEIIPAVGDGVSKAGFTFHRYVVGSPFEEERIRYSTTGIDDGRQSLGIYNTLSFIIEGKRYGDPANLIERRVRGQAAALEQFLGAIAARAEDVSKLVHAERLRLVDRPQRDTRVFVQMDYFPDPDVPKVSLPVFDLKEWKPVEKELEHFEPTVKVKKSVTEPVGYAIPGDLTEVIDLLRRHSVEMHRVAKDSWGNGEAYRIHHLAGRTEEEMQLPCLDVEKRSSAVQLKKGDVVIFLRQPGRLLIPLLLEPESTFGLVVQWAGQKELFDRLVKAGADYPIRRLTERPSAMLEPVE